MRKSGNWWEIFKNPGQEWRPKGSPLPVRMYDFRDRDLGIAIPYGVYDLTRNEGWVSVGLDHDTAQFAQATIECWWRRMGRRVYDGADAAADHSRRGREQRQPQPPLEIGPAAPADQDGLGDLGLPFSSRDEQMEQDVEHRMFCHITENWRVGVR